MKSFVVDVEEWLRRRSKSMKHANASLQIVAVKEIVDGVEPEIGRIDVTISVKAPSSRGVKVRLKIWDDRRVWIDARKASKNGWIWEFSDNGRFVSRAGARDLVVKVEDTLMYTHAPPREAEAGIQAVWRGALAKGPREIR